MRNFFFALILSACATTSTATHTTNVAHVRQQIWAAMQTQSPERAIAAMGKTSDERAVVYTKTKTGTRQEETWVRDGGSWKLEHAVAADGAVSSDHQM